MGSSYGLELFPLSESAWPAAGERRPTAWLRKIVHFFAGLKEEEECHLLACCDFYTEVTEEFAACVVHCLRRSPLVKSEAFLCFLFTSRFPVTLDWCSVPSPVVSRPDTDSICTEDSTSSMGYFLWWHLGGGMPGPDPRHSSSQWLQEGQNQLHGGLSQLLLLSGCRSRAYPFRELGFPQMPWICRPLVV